MGKAIAVIFLIVFFWYAVPIVSQGFWFSPTLYSETDWWDSKPYPYDPQVAQAGYGWFNFDPRNDPGPGLTTGQIFHDLKTR